MAVKLGRESVVSISNLKQKSSEVELKKYDRNHDNLLDVNEAADYYADKKAGALPGSVADVYKVAGGQQRSIKSYHTPHQFGSTYLAKGGFSVPGLGSGEVVTGRQNSGDDGRDRYRFHFDCSGFDRRFIEQGVAAATLVIGPRGFSAEKGSQLPEMVTVPLSVHTQDAYSTADRSVGMRLVPERKTLVAEVDTKDLRSLSRDQGLDFYVRLELAGGDVRYLNKDGKPYHNFQIDADELRKDEP